MIYIALLYLTKRGFIFVEQILAITAIVARKAWLKSDLQGFQTQRQSNMLKILKIMFFREKIIT